MLINDNNKLHRSVYSTTGNRTIGRSLNFRLAPDPSNHHHLSRTATGHLLSFGKKQYAIGTFYPEFNFDEDKKDIWQKRDIFSIEKCRTCRFSPICGGGCAYSSLLIFKNNKEPVCERYQETIDMFLKLKGKKILQKFLT